jgi:hypothetical protein
MYFICPPSKLRTPFTFVLQSSQSLVVLKLTQNASTHAPKSAVNSLNTITNKTSDTPQLDA